MNNDYYGKGLTRHESWELELANIPENLREIESELMQSRWFDYREMLPAQATYYFAYQYGAIYQDIYKRVRDLASAETIRALFTQDVFAGSDLIPIWRARQEADLIGCKYSFYIRFVMLRCWERGWSYIPRPNQLYSEELRLDIADSWAKERSSSLQLANQIRFKAESYVGHPDQDAYHRYLFDEIQKREHKHLAIARVVYKEKMLSEELAESRFGSDLMLRAKKFS